jgi:hypothetical protein
MRLVSFVADGGQRLGLPVGKRVIGPQRANLSAPEQALFANTVGFGPRPQGGASPNACSRKPHLPYMSSAASSRSPRQGAHRRFYAATKDGKGTTISGWPRCHVRHGPQANISYLTSPTCLARNAILEKLRTD